MINKQEHIRRQTCADLLISDIIRLSLADNAERIPFTNKGGYISTEMGENDQSFLESPEGARFSDTYSDGQDCFEYTTYAGDPKLIGLISAILKNHFEFKENSRLVAETHCEVDYF